MILAYIVSCSIFETGILCKTSHFFVSQENRAVDRLIIFYSSLKMSNVYDCATVCSEKINSNIDSWVIVCTFSLAELSKLHGTETHRLNCPSAGQKLLELYIVNLTMCKLLL
jgi:hypothetical protein